MGCLGNMWSLWFWHWCGGFALSFLDVVFCFLDWLGSLFVYFLKNRLDKCLCTIAVDISDSVLGENRLSELPRFLFSYESVNFNTGSTCHTLNISFIASFLSQKMD